MIDENNNLIEKEMVDYVNSLENQQNKSSKISKIILSILFLFIITILISIWISDYQKVKNNQEPEFCLSTQIYEFEDGSITQCIGLGYKIYKYERISLPRTMEFGTIFMKMREK